MSTSSSRSPVPASGLPVGVHPGPLGRRFVAYLIDLLPPAVMVAVSYVLIGRSDSLSSAASVYFVCWGLCLVWFVVVWAMFATRAAGPGMRVTGLQLVGLRNGRPVGWGRFLLRTLILAVVSATVIGLVILLVLLVRQPRRQGWHDLAADSVVIKKRPLAPRPGAAAPSRGRSSAGQVAPARAATSSAAPRASRPPEPSDDSVPIRPRRQASGSVLPRATQQAPPGPPDAGRTADQGWLAVLDDGRQVEVAGLVLLGRNPQPRPGEEDATLVKVADESRTVSKTHLSLRVEAGALFVTDRGSTNGTTLTVADGVSTPCPAGDVVPVSEGIVSFGGHWLRVERRPGDGRSEG